MNIIWVELDNPPAPFASLRETQALAKVDTFAIRGILRAPEDVRQLVVEKPDIPLRVIRDLSNVENLDDRAYLIDEVRAGSLTSNAITRILQQLKRAQREEVAPATVTIPISEQKSTTSSSMKSTAVATNEELPTPHRIDPIAEVIEEASRPRRAVSPAVALAALEQKLMRDSKQIQKITQRLTEDIMHMTPEEKRRVRESVDQWHIWTRQILDLASE